MLAWIAVRRVATAHHPVRGNWLGIAARLWGLRCKTARRAGPGSDEHDACERQSYWFNSYRAWALISAELPAFVRSSLPDGRLIPVRAVTVAVKMAASHHIVLPKIAGRWSSLKAGVLERHSGSEKRAFRSYASDQRPGRRFGSFSRYVGPNPWAAVSLLPPTGVSEYAWRGSRRATRLWESKGERHTDDNDHQDSREGDIAPIINEGVFNHREYLSGVWL